MLHIASCLARRSFPARTRATYCRAASSSSSSSSSSSLQLDNEHNNVPDNVAAKVGEQLHQRPHHPLNMIKTTIEEHFRGGSPGDAQRACPPPTASFRSFDDLSPVVTTKACFDDLLTPPDHVSRRPSDTFYVDAETVLRTHTSAHQNELMRAGHGYFVCTGDVYRRDAIDASHYPIFHQMEGVRVFSHDEVSPDLPRNEAVALVQADLQHALEGMVRAVFGDVEMRWVDAYFPFTDPSLELEIFFRDEWLEVLGSGVIQQQILTNCGRGDEIGWAFGLGLERLAMVLYGIPDIRLFWSRDERFTSQFAPGSTQPCQFKPFSKFPPVFKDVSFWLPEGVTAPATASSSNGDGSAAERDEDVGAGGGGLHENDVYDAARSVAGDLVERMELIDEFTHPKTARQSHCYRITYRSMEENLTNEVIDELQFELRDRLVSMGAELR